MEKNNEQKTPSKTKVWAMLLNTFVFVVLYFAFADFVGGLPDQWPEKKVETPSHPRHKSCDDPDVECDLG